MASLHVAIAGVTSSWNRFFPQWHLPTIWHGDGLYDSVGREVWTDAWREGPTCAGQPASPFNAIYCPANDTVAWDLALLQRYEKAIGLWFPHLVVAHEVGHAVQDRLKRAGQGYLVWPEQELQADCFAGAFVYREANDGFLNTMPGDPDELYAGLAALGDAEPWANPGDHGDPSERVFAFRTGYQGPDACLRPWPPAPDPIPTEIVQNADTRDSLVTPSGNIRCGYIDSLLKCTIYEFDFPSKCTAGGMPMITMGVIDPPSVTSCAGIALASITKPEPTEYGAVVELGPYTCDVEKTGLSCFNSVGDGFKVRRAALTFD